MSSKATRIEHDLLGDKAVPADGYYGVQPERENIYFSGVELRVYPNLIKPEGSPSAFHFPTTPSSFARARPSS